MNTEKKNRRVSVGRIIREMPNRKALLLSVILLIISALALVTAPRVSGKLLDYFSETIKAGGTLDAGHVLRTCLLLALLYALGNLTVGFVNSRFAGICQTMIRELRDRISRKLLHTSIRNLDSKSTGDMQARVTADVDNFSFMLGYQAPIMIQAVVQVVFVVIAMLLSNWKLALCYLGMMAVSFVGLRLLSPLANRYNIRQVKLQAEMAEMIEDTYSNHLIIKSYGAEENCLKKYDETCKRFDKVYVRMRFVMTMFSTLTFTCDYGAYLLTCLFGAIMMISGSMTIGTFQAFIFFGNLFSAPFTMITGGFAVIISGLNSASRMYEFLDEEEPEVEPPTDSLKNGTFVSCASFEKVDFRYVPNTPFMEQVSFAFPEGTKTAIVGPSGSGKTSVINLLMRFYEIQGGRITLSGKDIRTLPTNELRRSIGMVLQDPWIFYGTVAENIAYGKPDATMEEIIQAAEAVRCHLAIRKLPDGYNTILGGSTEWLSAGERQLVAIARCILADPQFLILDEATSQLDISTEALVNEALDKLMNGRTSVVIAHRLSTIESADQILYMENGRVLESGSHRELVEKNGKYMALLQSR